MGSTVIQVEQVGKRYQLGQREQYQALRDVVADAAARATRRLRGLGQGAAREGVPAEPAHLWALRDLSFQVEQGTAIGIVGRNGAGKSTLLKILSRITKPTRGEVKIRGRVGSLLEVGTGFHPELTGRENIYLNGIVLGMHKAEVDRKFDEIVAFAEVETFLDTPVKRYSSGMYVRLAFAVAAHLESEILIVDEVLAVGDAAFQKKCLGKMSEVTQAGRTVLFVSHNIGAIQRLCPTAMLLEGGQLVAQGSTTEVVQRYLAEGADEAGPARWIDMGPVYRRGSGQATVEGVWYSSHNEAAACRPYARGPVEFRLAVCSDAPRTIRSVAVMLYDRHGTKLVNADTLSLGESVPLQQGRNILRLRIEALYLNPGTYVLGTWLGDAFGNPIDLVENVAQVEVVSLDSLGPGRRPRSDGTVVCDFALLEAG